jgi:hypothetical protein
MSTLMEHDAALGPLRFAVLAVDNHDPEATGA